MAKLFVAFLASTAVSASGFRINANVTIRDPKDIAMTAEAKECGFRSHYDVLGIDTSATPAEVRTAYRGKALINHPDKGGDPKKFHAVARAHEVLSDEGLRARYDRISKDMRPEFPTPGAASKPSSAGFHAPRTAAQEWSSFSSFKPSTGFASGSSPGLSSYLDPVLRGDVVSDGKGGYTSRPAKPWEGTSEENCIRLADRRRLIFLNAYKNCHMIRVIDMVDRNGLPDPNFPQECTQSVKVRELEYVRSDGARVRRVFLFPCKIERGFCVLPKEDCDGLSEQGWHDEVEEELRSLPIKDAGAEVGPHFEAVK